MQRDATVIDLCSATEGSIWKAAPKAGVDGKGVLLSVRQSRSGRAPPGTNLVRFSHVTFDDSGAIFAAATQQGSIYAFDLQRNKFWLVHRTGTPCTAIAFGSREVSEVLTGHSDNTFRCFDTNTGTEAFGSEEGQSCVHHISVHSRTGDVMATAANEVLMWEMARYRIKRRLDGAKTLGVQQALYSADGAVSLVCFRNDEIVAWETDSLQHMFKLQAVAEPHSPRPGLRSLATSRDGCYLVAGGRSRTLFVWNLQSAVLKCTIEMPKPARSIRHVAFVWRGPDARSQIAAVLCDDGVLRFVDIHSCRMVASLGDAGSIDSFAACPNGRYLVVVLALGSIELHDLAALLSPPPRSTASTRTDDLGVGGSSSTGLSAAAARVGGRHSAAAVAADGAGGSAVAGAGEGLRSYVGSARSATTRRTLSSSPGRSRKKPTQPPANHVPKTAEQPIREDRLMEVLHGYGEYPAKYRKYIWRQLLRLPENFEAYNSLLAKGTHSAYARLHERFPLRSRKILRIFQRNLSALAHWAPIFGEIEYLPELAFPIIKFYENSPFVSFEILVTFLTNWCQQWFDFFPNPPINVLSMVDNILAHHDPTLYKQLYIHKINSQVYAWPMLKTMFSEVFTESEWMTVWDNVISNRPSFLLHLCVAYLTHNRISLLQCSHQSEFEYFFHRKNPVNIAKIVETAYAYAQNTPAKIDPDENSYHPFFPLTIGQYPVFNKFPAYIVDYEIQERERIRDEEVRFLEQRALAVESRNQAESLRLAEDVWHQQQELLQLAEADRRKRILQEDQKLEDQRVRVDALKREQHIVEMQSFEKSRKTFVNRQMGLRQMEMDRLGDEAKRKASLRVGAGGGGGGGGVGFGDGGEGGAVGGSSTFAPAAAHQTVVDKFLQQRDELLDETARMHANTQSSAARHAEDRAQAAAAYQLQQQGGGGAPRPAAAAGGRAGRMFAWEAAKQPPPENISRADLNLLHTGEEPASGVSRFEDRRLRDRRQTNLVGDVLKLRRRFAASTVHAPPPNV